MGKRSENRCFNPEVMLTKNKFLSIMHNRAFHSLTTCPSTAGNTEIVAIYGETLFTPLFIQTSRMRSFFLPELVSVGIKYFFHNKLLNFRRIAA